MEESLLTVIHSTCS